MDIDLQEAIKSATPPAPPPPRIVLQPVVAAEFRPERSETGVWVGISAIVMCFAAFTSAMIVRQGASNDWVHFSLPRMLYATTAILLASSATLSLAQRKLAESASAKRDEAKQLYSEGLSWLYGTLALGIFFVVGQILGWRILADQGLFLSSNPSASFFYVLTATHALHLLGGLGGLLYVLRKLSKANGRVHSTGLRAFSLYWHFMDGLWLYLFILLLVRT